MLFLCICRYILSTAFSTTSALTDLSSVFYSLIYTSIPTIVVGILDKDLNDETLLQYPRLYGAGHRQESYNMRLFWITMIDTLWQSLVIFYIPVFIYSDSSIDIWSMGSLWTITVVILVNVHLAMDVQRWIFVTHVAVWGSIIITYACLIAVDSIPIFPNYGLVSSLIVINFLRYTFYDLSSFFQVYNVTPIFSMFGRTIYHLAKSPSYWLSIFLILTIALLPRFLFKVIRQNFWPSDIQITREAEILGDQPDNLPSKSSKGSGWHVYYSLLSSYFDMAWVCPPCCIPLVLCCEIPWWVNISFMVHNHNIICC